MAVSCSWSLSCCWWWCWCCGWLPHQHLNWGQQSFSLDSVCVPLWSRGPFKSMFVICISHAFELTALAAHILLLIIAIGQPATAATLLLQQQQQHHCRSSRSSSNASAFWPYPHPLTKHWVQAGVLIHAHSPNPHAPNSNPCSMPCSILHSPSGMTASVVTVSSIRYCCPCNSNNSNNSNFGILACIECASRRANNTQIQHHGSTETPIAITNRIPIPIPKPSRILLLLLLLIRQRSVWQFILEQSTSSGGMRG